MEDLILLLRLMLVSHLSEIHPLNSLLQAAQHPVWRHLSMSSQLWSIQFSALLWLQAVDWGCFQSCFWGARCSSPELPLAVGEERREAAGVDPSHPL